MRLLSATREGRVTQAQIAVLGALGGVDRIVVKLDGRRVATLRGGRSVMTVRLRRRGGRRMAVEALAADGRALDDGERPRPRRPRRQARRRHGRPIGGAQ